MQQCYSFVLWPGKVSVSGAQHSTAQHSTAQHSTAQHQPLRVLLALHAGRGFLLLPSLGLILQGRHVHSVTAVNKIVAILGPPTSAQMALDLFLAVSMA